MINELIFASAAFFHPPVLMDSIGIETINGKVFILHQVGEKETLYAVSRRYGVAVDVILQYNPTADAGINIGQIIKVPYVPRRIAKAADGSTHVVAAKETMFSISQAYGVSIDDIKLWNNLTSNALSIGQELIIRKPAGSARPATTSANTGTVVKSPAAGTHIVAPKETMYSISRQYNITVQELKDWNRIESNDISIGQELLVAAPGSGQTLSPTVATTTVADNATTPAATTVPSGSPNTNQSQAGPATATVQSATPPSTTAPKKPDPQPTASVGSEQTVKISESVKSADEILETGLAELIDGTEGNRKYLALHRTAPAGTILKVKNEMNNREVFVRVMGKLPDNALNNKLVIKISKSAYDRLGAIDPRFRVEVTYYK